MDTDADKSKNNSQKSVLLGFNHSHTSYNQRYLDQEPNNDFMCRDLRFQKQFWIELFPHTRILKHCLIGYANHKNRFRCTRFQSIPRRQKMSCL
jgi:hypothetical protein